MPQNGSLRDSESDRVDSRVVMNGCPTGIRNGSKILAMFPIAKQPIRVHVPPQARLVRLSARGAMVTGSIEQEPVHPETKTQLVHRVKSGRDVPGVEQVVENHVDGGSLLDGREQK